MHQKPAKNTTKQLFFLTRERGLVRAFFAGGSRKKTQSVLQPFTPVWLTLNERHYGAYVKQVEISAPPVHLVGDALLSGLYLNELLYRALKPELSDADLFEAYARALSALSDATHQVMIEIALRCFEQRLIEASGYAFSYQYEANKESEITKAGRYRFLPGNGFVSDEMGFLGEHLLAIAEENWHDTAVLKTAKQIMRRAIDDLLDGAVIKTRRLYASVKE